MSNIPLPHEQVELLLYSLLIPEQALPIGTDCLLHLETGKNCFMILSVP